MGMKLGIFGGTFDPIHAGHLIIAQEARVRLGLGRVVLVPTGQPWMKSAQPVSSAAHRLAMTRLAVAGDPGFSVSSLEVDRTGPTYTVDTLAQLRRDLPGEPEIYFIMGADSLEGLDRWKEPERLLRLCSLVVVSRPGNGAQRVESVERRFPMSRGRVHMLGELNIGIQASEIRQRVAQGLPIRYWVPREVEEYVLEHGLYSKQGEGG